MHHQDCEIAREAVVLLLAEGMGMEWKPSLEQRDLIMIIGNLGNGPGCEENSV